MSIEHLIVVGDRINPGFKSTKTLIENEDIEGLQALAVRQVEAGAHYIDVTVGPRGYTDAYFLTAVVKALQNAVDAPLCFDYPSAAAQEVCLKAYDPAKANGQRPMVNSLAETRMEILELLRICPFRVVIMASEYLQDGVPKPAKHTEEVVGVARRLSAELAKNHGFIMDDIFVDITINSLVSDTEGLTKMALEAIREIGADTEMRGIHIMGGLTNIGNMLPPLEYDGMRLRHAMECAFLTTAIPLGFDTVLGTPWNAFQILPENHEVLRTFREVVNLRGLDAMRRLRQLWAKKPPQSSAN
jgi:5-methyltetrahydrofolate--homocysteine methyltransferase